MREDPCRDTVEFCATAPGALPAGGTLLISLGLRLPRCLMSRPRGPTKKRRR